MPANTNILEGLHVLLVSEDEQRTQALGKALRERRANVGDLKSSSRDPIALRGADVLVIDTRSAQNTQTRVGEMRADVRARWASVVNLDFAKVLPDGGELQFALLENALAPVTAADRALTDRARKEPSFTTDLLPLGPTRILRALGMAGTTLQVEFAVGSEGKASLTLSNELLVSCFMERAGTRFEAWKALARVLGLSDASVTVARLQHPSAMNIMEPLDQALATAAQERHAAAAEIANEDAANKKAEAKPAAEPFKPASPASLGSSVSAAKDMRVQPGRTIMGLAPAIARPAPPVPAPPAPKVAAPPPAPTANVAAAKPMAPVASVPQSGARPAGGAELGKPGRTMMGIAPGSLPALGAFGVRSPAKPEAPEPPAPAPMELQPTPTHVAAPGRSMTSGVEAKPVPPAQSAVPEADSDLLHNLDFEPANNQRELMPTLPAPAPSEADLHFNELGGSRVERIERVSLGDTPTDPAPPRVSQPGDPMELEGEEDTAVTQSGKIDEIRAEVAKMRQADLLSDSGSTLGDDFAGFGNDVRAPAATVPFDASSLARSAEPTTRVSTGTGPMNFSRDESQEETITMERPESVKRNGRTIALAVLLLLAAGEIGYVVWSRTKQAAPPVASAPAAPATPAKAEALPSAPAAAAPTAQPPAPTAPAAPSAEAQAPAPAAAPAASAPTAAAAAEPAAPTVAPSAPAPSAAPAAAAPADEGAANPEALEALIKDGTRLLAEKNPSMAKPLFEAALARDSKNPHAQAGLGQALLELGEPALAQASFETAIKLRPKRSRYRVQLGDALKAQGKNEEARAAWEKALEVDPADRDAPKRLGK
ncbi:MAG: tetratricopeptide repeat protein [Myxococcales bacterium]